MGAGVIYTPTGNSLVKKITRSGIDLNGTGDRITFTDLPSVPYVIERLLIHTWSTTPSVTLSMTLRDAATGGGNSLAGTMSGLNVAITNTILVLEALPNASLLGTKRSLTANTLYLNAGTGNGSALTASATLIIKIL